MFTYRFTFISSQGVLEFGANKVPNWENLKVKLTENDYYRGVFFEYTDTFEFCSDARVYIRDLVEREGMDADLQLKIEQGNESGHSSSFVRFGNENLVAQFNDTYEMNETSCNVSFVESGFKQKVINREDSNVDYQTCISVDGDEITPYSNEYLPTSMHDRIVKLINIARLDRSRSGSRNNYYISGEIYRPYSTLLEASSDDNVNNTVSTVNDNDVERMLILKPDTTTTYKIRFAIKSQVVTITDIGLTNPTISLLYAIYDDDLVRQSITLFTNIATFGSSTNSIYSKDVDIDVTKDIEVLKGYSLALLTRVDDGLGNTYEHFFEINDEGDDNSNIVDISSDSFFEATIINTVPIFEAINRNLQVITGQQNSFKSNIFGKTSNGYSEDGELAYNVLANGKMVRGFPFSDSKFNLNFRDIVKDLINQHNLVGFFSFDGENTFFNLERFTDVYDLNNSVELDNVSDISITLDSDWHYGIIKYGIKNYEYEEVNGLDSFNGEFERITPLKSTDKKLDIRLKKLRSDDYGIEFTRRKTYATSPTEDYRSDENNFLIDCKSVEHHQYSIKAVQAEDYDLVTGIYSPDTAYNLRLSAGRQLKEWYNILAPSLNYKSDKFIKFVSGAKNDNLQTRLTGEENTLIEKADIDITDLGRAIILPFNIKFKCILDFDKYNTIKLNPHKTIKVAMIDKGEKFFVYGFIKNLEYDINKGEAKMTLLRANR